MAVLIVLLTGILLLYLYRENRLATEHRQAIAHVVYVNGTRGKSSVTRLIDAGLRAGGLRTFCKTTGTLPMIIDASGTEQLIRRRGKANIKEQLWVLSRAAAGKADVLVAECMAVHPQYQHISQHRMMRADIGVITNVRLDHTDVMGKTLPEIAHALSNTIPQDGILFTAEQDQLAILCAEAASVNAQVQQVLPDDPALLQRMEAIDFPENVALALAVCTHLGADFETALAGMASSYQRDPYALSLYKSENGALVIGGLSINDPQSSVLVYRRLEERLGLSDKRLVLLINNRGDRVTRTAQMADLARELSPAEIWLLGAGQRLLIRKLRAMLPDVPVKRFRHPQEIDFATLCEADVLFAAGNIAEQGKRLMERIQREGTPYDVL